MVYKKQHIISGSQCGANAELSLVGAFAVVQDAVTELMGSLNIDGITAQRKYGAMWVFSKNRIKFIKDAFWGEVVQVESYISNASLVRLYVETIIKNKNNEIILTAKTEICGIDLETKKVRKVETIGVKQEMIENKYQNDVMFSKSIVPVKTLVFSDLVKSSNIDFCHHTNNVEYVRFVVNSYSIQELYKLKIKEFEIDYINQSFEGEKLDIFCEKLEKSHIIEIKHGETLIVKCELVIEK